MKYDFNSYQRIKNIILPAEMLFGRLVTVHL